MKSHYQLAIIGAGPAGMAAAAEAAASGATCVVFDEQPAPGGQIYRAVETPAAVERAVFGPDYWRGLELTRVLRECGADYVPRATVWQVSAIREIGVTVDGVATLITADQVIVATGALERPFPVSGWTLPSVMTAGGAQVLLKSAAVVADGAVFVGTGPLLYLVVWQYLQAGVSVKAVLDTTPRSNYLRAARHLPGALRAPKYLMKGIEMIRGIYKARVPLIRGVTDLRLLGEDSVSAVEYRRASDWQRIEADQVFLHQGVTPNVNLAYSIGCQHTWNETQLCWQAITDLWGQTSIDGIAIAGDGAGINGAVAAEHQGRMAALGALYRLDIIDVHERDRRAAPLRNALVAERRIRPFLETLYRPLKCFRVPRHDDTIVCRCEEVNVAQIRKAVAVGCVGPNQLKSFSRCGMGPCQGRLCGLTVSELIADMTELPVSEVGYYRLRPPIKPLLLEELAELQVPATRS